MLSSSDENLGVRRERFTTPHDMAPTVAALPCGIGPRMAAIFKSRQVKLASELGTGVDVDLSGSLRSLESYR